MSSTQDDQPTEAISRRSARSAESRAAGRSSKKPPAVDPESGEPATPTGIAAIIAKHPKAWLASALGVAFLLLGTGAVFAGIAVGSNGADAATPSGTESSVPSRTLPSAIPVASRLRTCSIAALAADPLLMSFSGQVVKVATGEVLFDRAGTVGARTGSVLKVLTASAAIAILGPNGQLSTRVVDGTSPGTIVLVGGGDPTLSSSGGNYYSGSPSIIDLAAQARSNYDRLHPGVPITQVILDSTMWDPADNWDSSWLRKEQRDGYQAPVTALMVDGARENPSRSVSTRVDDPITQAGEAFVDAMGLSGVSFGSGAAAPGREQLAEVKSQPVSTLVDQMLKSSDNVLAEMLARVVSKTMGFNGGSASLQQAIPGALRTFEIDTAGLTIRDGSGLSDLNSVPPAFVNQLMIKVAGGGKDLNFVLSGLPVAGVSGSLANRFTGANEVARGNVTAKTGWLDAAYSLAGIVNAADGNQFVFAFYAIGDGISEDAKQSLDTLTTGVYNCGDNLSNN